MWQFIIGVLVGLGAAFVFNKAKVQRGKSRVINPQQVKDRADNIDKILKWLETADKITNTDVENLLGVSDATATRYLDELEQRGEIRQIGSRGRGIYYEKIKTRPTS